MAPSYENPDGRLGRTAARVANLIQQGANPYVAAGYANVAKAGFDGYAAQVAAVICGDGRVVEIGNQGTRDESRIIAFSRLWLDRDDSGWVHCFSNNLPNPSRYRVYVCTRLSETHNVLRQLLQGYGGSLKFKVAAHSEARRRNDTIVSWHANLREARDWADIARANANLLEGVAPAGTFGGPDADGVGIDTEVAGDTSTHRIARAATEILEKLERAALRHNPYVD